MEPIIVRRSLHLGASFDSVKKKIETDAKYAGLRRLCEFYPDEKRLEYDTERIYPPECVERISILFLFSNPHPDSVRRGLFFSEPHSRAFWQRLFESEHFRMRPSDENEIHIECWDKTTPKRLGKLMVEGRYKSGFLLYFHCLYPVPTNQLKDLESLFNSDTELWKAFVRTSQEELVRLINEKDIKHIVAFTVPLFQMMTETNKPGWRDLVSSAKNDYPTGDFPKDECVAERHARLFLADANDADVYMGLDTRWKNVVARKKERYFTLILDAILKKIRESDLPPKNQSQL